MKMEDDKLAHFLGQWEEFRKNHEDDMKELKDGISGVSDRVAKMESKYEKLATIVGTAKWIGLGILALLTVGLDGLLKLKWW